MKRVRKDLLKECLNKSLLNFQKIEQRIDAHESKFK